MQLGDDRHASDEVLEQYSMGRLNARTLKTFEEHLLICATCQDNLEAMDAYRASMRTAARDLRRQAGTRTQEWASRCSGCLSRCGAWPPRPWFCWYSPEPAGTRHTVPRFHQRWSYCNPIAEPTIHSTPRCRPRSRLR